MMRLRRHGIAAGVLAVAAVTGLAACGSSGSSGQTSTPSGVAGVYGKVPPAASGPQHTGTITLGWPANSAPTWILPLVTSGGNSVYSVTLFDYLMWRPLYWTEVGAEPKFNPTLSLADYPTVSNGDKTFTIKLKSGYKWSDGTPVTSKDVLFWYDLMVAAVKESAANWAYYTPGVGMPDQVASVTAPNSSTVVFTLKSAVNPTWFTLNELSVIQPMPAQAWARSSANGPLLNYANPANAKAIYNYLSAQSKSEGTWATNPLWKTVDGPYKLTAFNSSNGAFTMTPNTSYGGPHVAHMSVYKGVPFASDTAEYNAVRSGSLAIGYVPLTNLPQINQIKSLGYNVFGYPDFGWLYIVYNFKDTTGHFNDIISQLYIRQALAHLQDQAGEIRAFFNGAAAPGYGPIPSLPKSPYTPSNATSNPYPYSVSDAVNLLKAHGWKIVPNGTDTCVRPGTGPNECGAGIPAGTALSWNLPYTTTPTNIGEEVTAFASAARKAGIEIHLQSSNFQYMISNYNDPSAPANDNKWAMQDFGGFTDSTYPTTFTVLNCNGSSNIGDYCNSTADSYIHNSVFGTNPSAVTAEARFLTQNQPALFQPNPAAAMESGAVLVWKKTLSGQPDAFATITQYYINPELMYFTK